MLFATKYNAKKDGLLIIYAIFVVSEEKPRQRSSSTRTHDQEKQPKKTKSSTSLRKEQHQSPTATSTKDTKMNPSKENERLELGAKLKEEPRDLNVSQLDN